MRKVAAAGLAVPVILLIYASTFLRRSVLARFGVLAVAAALVVTGLAVGLAPKQIDARGPSTFAPLSPSSYTARVQSEQPLTLPVEIEFSKPMNEASVGAGFSIAPATAVSLTWDERGQLLTVAPSTHWSPVTYYTVDIAGSAKDRAGTALGQPVHTYFVTEGPPTGALQATVPVGGLVSPATRFQLTFNSSVKLSTVQSEFHISPTVIGAITGDDPGDQNSRVFVFTPLTPLAPDAWYSVSFGSGGADTRGVEIASVASLTVKTVSAPDVVRFRPLDKATDVDPAQALSVRFTMPMDTGASTAAFTAVADGKAVTGTTRWAEDDTVLLLTPKAKLPAGAKVTLAVSTAARSKSGAQLTGTHTATFTVAKPAATAPAATGGSTGGGSGATKKPTPITPPSTGGGAIGSAPWLSAEQYYLSLMNCTRTGGWVTSSGACGSSNRHTLRAEPALMLDSGISSRVARPFAKLMADRGILNHFADGTPGTRLARAGYTSYHWGENIGSPSSVMRGMVDVELFFQNEAPCRCEHYKNIMDPQFDRAGIGVWVTSGRVRVVIDFYHP